MVLSLALFAACSMKSVALGLADEPSPPSSTTLALSPDSLELGTVDAGTQALGTFTLDVTGEVTVAEVTVAGAGFTVVSDWAEASLSEGSYPLDVVFQSEVPGPHAVRWWCAPTSPATTPTKRRSTTRSAARSPPLRRPKW